MKRFKHDIGLSCLIICLCLSLSQGEEREAYIKSMIGTVSVRKGQSPTWKEGRPTMVLKEKDAIRTFVESQAEVMTSEGSVLKLDENTTMEMSTLKDFGGNVQATKVKILNGSILANVKKLVNTGSSFEFETPTAVASIRGTTVGLDVTGDQTLVKVYEGVVVVKPKGGTTGASVKTNQMITIVKGEKNAKIETMTEKDKGSVVVPEPATPLKSATDTTVKKDTTKQLPVNTQAQLFLQVVSPTDGQKIGTTVITVSGMTTIGAEVTVSGVKCPVSASGAFSGKVPIPDEENQINIEVDATLGNQAKTIVRSVQYQSDLTLMVTSPANGQIVSTPTVQVAGQVLPSSSETELTIDDTKIALGTNGRFNQMIAIPQEEGQIVLEFEAKYQNIVKKETRTITFTKPIDDLKPTIAPLSFPKYSKTKIIPFTVLDRTSDDEITFYRSIDGARESETGRPNSSFNVTLDEGFHDYIVYAEDLAKNRSAQVSGTVAYLERSFQIQMRKPLGSEVIRLPPSTPVSGGFSPQYTVKFAILNVPDNDRRLIQQVSVTNLTTGQVVTQHDILDLEMEFDIELKRGVNRLSVDVKDINDRVFSVKDLVVEIR